MEGLVFMILGMVFALVVLGWIWKFSREEGERKAGVKLERERERTHREIAAYVAQGAISPEDAERLIRAMAESDMGVEGVRETLRRPTDGVALGLI